MSASARSAVGFSLPAPATAAIPTAVTMVMAEHQLRRPYSRFRGAKAVRKEHRSARRSRGQKNFPSTLPKPPRATLLLPLLLQVLLPRPASSFSPSSSFFARPPTVGARRYQPPLFQRLGQPFGLPLQSAPSTLSQVGAVQGDDDDDDSDEEAVFGGDDDDDDDDDDTFLDESALLSLLSGEDEAEDDDADDEEDGEETVEDLSLSEIANLIVEQVPVGRMDADQVELLRHVLRNAEKSPAPTAPSSPLLNLRPDDEGDGVRRDDDGGILAQAESNVDPRAVARLLYRLVDEFKSKMGRILQGDDDDDEEDWVSSMISDDDFSVAVRAWKGSMPPEGLPFSRFKGRGGEAPNRHPSDVMERVLELFGTQLELHRRLVAEKNDAASRLAPSPGLVEAVLAVVAAHARERKSVDREAGDVVRSYQEAHPSEVPTELMYRYWIEATAKSRSGGNNNNKDRRGGGGGRCSADRAESILKQAVRAHPPRRDDEGNVAGMTVDSFNVILTSWAKSGLEYGPDRAEKLLVWMEQVGGGGGGGGEGSADAILRPTVSSFTSLVDAYAQTNDWDGVAKAENILNRMLEMHLEGDNSNGDMEPNIATWTIVISAWARLSKKHYKGAANRAHQLLKRMETLHSEGRISFAPDAIVYVTCMNAFAFSKATDGPQMAREMLDEMYERYLDGDDTMKPSSKSMRIVIGSFVDLGSAESMGLAEQALDHYEDLLESVDGASEDPMEHLRDVYRNILFGWCKVDDPVAAQSYLLDMVDRDMKPDCFCWDKVIECNARKPEDRNSLKRTLRLWQLMNEEERKGNVKPNERVYTSYIRALTKAKVTNLATQSMELLDEMKEGYRAGNKDLKPTVFTCNAVLLACSEDATAPDDAFRAAVQVFNDLRATPEGPDQVSFGNMLRCAKLLPPGDRRDALVRSTFQLCCKRGFVNSFVVRDLQSVAEEPVWRNLLQCPVGEANPDSLPATWTSKFAAASKRRTGR